MWFPPAPKKRVSQPEFPPLMPGPLPEEVLLRNAVMELIDHVATSYDGETRIALIDYLSKHPVRGKKPTKWEFQDTSTPTLKP